MQPLSILSMALRLPGADSAEAFWSLLTSGQDAVRPVPPERFSFGEAPNLSLSNRAAILDDIRGFDPAYFGMSAEDAAWMDPQQRLIMELAVEALARAGLGEERRVGVFVGASFENFQELVIERMKHQIVPASTATGSLRNLIAARVSWQLDLRGPAMTVDSACSSTLVALHQGAQAVRAGECTFALVGGVHLMVSPTPMTVMSRAGALSPSGVCRPFDPRADGFVIGEGGGMFVIGPSRAGALAHILASAVNNDGRSRNPMAPRPEGQIEVIRRAWAQAGRAPTVDDAVEAHGTGTRVGDVVEAASLAAVFPPGTAVGCVKSQVGHLMSAAGVPALARAVLSFYHRALPPTLHGERTLPALGGLRVPRQVEPFPGERIGVNSFGFGGTNAHLILARTDAVDFGRWTSPFSRVPCWPDAPLQHVAGRFDPAGHPALEEHRVNGQPILPAAALIDAVLRVSGRAALAQLRFLRPVSGAFAVQIEGERWEIVHNDGVCAMGVFAEPEPAEWAPSEGEPVEPAALYAAMRARGMAHGAWFQRLMRLWRHPGGAGGALLGVRDEHRLHPGVFDAALQVVAATLPDDAPLQIPASIEQISVLGPAGGALRVEALRRDDGAFDVVVAGEAPVAVFRGFRLAPVGEAAQRLVWEPAEAAPIGEACVIDVREIRTFEGLCSQIAALRVLLAQPPARLQLRTRGAFAGNAAAAALLGLAQALPAEFPGVKVFATDGDGPDESAPEGLGVWREGGYWRLAARPATPQVGVVRGRWLVVGAGGGIGRALVGALLGAGVEVIGAGRNPQEIPGVRFITADLAADAGALLDAAGSIDGVLVLAGVVRPGGFLRKSAEEIAEVLRPKVTGVAALAAALDARGLDPEVVLFSSIAAEPAFAGGLLDYAAANFALDAMALARGPRWSAVRWGAWSVGMGQGSAGLPMVQTAAALRLWPGLRGGLWRVSGRAAPAGEVPAPAGEAPEALRTRIRALAAALIGVDADEIREDQSLFSAGLDSLMAVDLVKRLEQEGFGPLPATLVFQVDTVQALAAHLAGQKAAPKAEIATPAQAKRFPLGQTQRALAMQRRLEPGFAPYAYLRLTLRHPPDPDRILSALQVVIGRHPMLRISPDEGENCPRPQHAPWLDRREGLDDVEILNAPMDARGPLHVVISGAHLAFRLDHRAGDAWSLQNVAGEVMALAADPAAALPEVSDAFERFVAEDPPWPPASAPPPHWLWSPSPAGRRALVARDLDAADSAKVEAAARALGLTLPALLLGAWVRALCRFTHEDSAVVNVAVARRERRIPGIASAVGCFADTVALQLSAGEDLAGAARSAQPQLHGALLRAPSYTPAPGFSFARFPGLIRSQADAVVGATASAATRLGLAVWQFDGRLGLSVNFAEGLFSAEFAADALEALLDELGLVAQSPLPIARWVGTERLAILGAEPLSYSALWAWSGALAAAMKGPAVAVRLAQGTPAVVALVAALRAGCAIVPLHPTDPPARTAAVLAELGLSEALDEAAVRAARGGGATLTTRRSAWAYLLATSGTTGAPRLVPILRSSLRKYLDAAQGAFAYSPDDRAVALAPLAFDAAMRQVLSPLFAGGAVLPVPPALARDPEALAAQMRAEAVNVWSSVPALWERVSQHRLPPLRLVQLGGEAPTAQHAARSEAPVWNLYGPTEATINATWHQVEPGEDPIALGEPVPGAALCVVDGELWVRGAGLSPGYWGGVGRERFAVREGRRWFRTGDRVRVYAGRLYWLGRTDDQLKIRGHRIESGEVLAALRALEGVVDATVVLVGDQLRAFVTGVLPEDAAAKLADRLPEAARPASIERVDALPRTPAGKLDRAALRGDPIERLVAGAWRAVLGVNPGPTSHFFAEGGNSLRVLDLFERLAALPALPRPGALYDRPVFADFCELLREQAPQQAAEEQGWRPLSPVQLGFSMAGQAASAFAGWRDLPRTEGLSAAFSALQARHPALRMEVAGRRWRPGTDAALPLLEQVLATDELEAHTEEALNSLESLSFGQWRAVALHTPASTRLVLGAHHAVGDARSVGILWRELAVLLRGEALPPLRAGFFAEDPPDPLTRPYWSRALDAPRLALPPGEVRHAEATLPVTEPAALLNALWRALVRQTGQTTLRIGVVVDGRDAAGAIGAIGPFAHLLPLRLDAPRAAAALAELRENRVPAGTLARWFPGLEPEVLTGSAVMVSIFPDDGLQSRPAPLPFGTRLQLIARVRGAEAHLRLCTASPALDPTRLLRWMEQSLNLGNPQVGLVAYLPSGVVAPTTEPFDVARVRTPIGTSRVVALPLSPQQVQAAPDLADRVAAAVARSRASGAGLVSLAGLLPALTAFGEAVPAQDLTTGHAATVVAVVKTVEAVLSLHELESPVSLGILGCGSIGLGVLDALSKRFSFSRVVLCDRSSARKRLEPWLLRFNASFVEDPNAMDTRLMIGATSTPDVLDVRRLRPGTVVVDDSFPPCLDVAAAQERMIREGDICVVGGGLLAFSTGAIEVTPAPGMPPIPPVFGLPGCQIEPLLFSQLPDPPRVRGPVQPEDVQLALALADAMGLVAAPLHLGDWAMERPMRQKPIE